MLLTLTGRFRDASLGADLQPAMLRLLQNAAEIHGFQVAQLKSFGQPLPAPRIAPVIDLDEIGSVNSTLAFG
jgi:hypothetical protein